MEKFIRDGKMFELTEKKPQRSRSQNNYLHLALSYFAAQTGDTLEWVKQKYYKELVNPQTFVRERDDKFLGRVKYLRSSAELDIAEFSLTVERFRNWSAAQAGIYIPSPEDQALLEMAEMAVRGGTRIVAATPHCNVRGRFENYEDSGERVRVLFPEHYEEAVENTPARLLVTHHHGAGGYYRQCFYDRELDYKKYDETFFRARAEEEPERAFAVNKTGTRNVAAACAGVGAKMIYISTDYVFAGAGEAFYETYDAAGPLNVYGRSKLAGEQAVRELLDRYFIVRISWVFGRNGNNFIKTMLRLAESRSEVRVVCDQIGSPTYTADLAPLLCDMTGTEKYGVYHATNEGVCSWAELAQEVFHRSGKAVHVEPILTAEYPTKAVRPLNSRLSKRALDEAGFSRLPCWQDALDRFLKELEGNKQTI